MKSLLILLATILFLTTNIHSQFRKSTWGMSEKEVKAVETSELSGNTEGMLYCSGNVGGMDTFIAYVFVNNKLVNASYLFKEKHSNKTEFINDYKDLKEILIQKYGKPDDDDIIWYDDLYRDDPSDWGMAISKGDLAYQSVWEDKKTQIILTLKGDNYKITLIMGYKSVELQYLKEEEKKAKDTDDF